MAKHAQQNVWRASRGQPQTSTTSGAMRCREGVPSRYMSKHTRMVEVSARCTRTGTENNAPRESRRVSQSLHPGKPQTISPTLGTLGTIASAARPAQTLHDGEGENRTKGGALGPPHIGWGPEKGLESMAPQFPLSPLLAP